MRFALVGNPNVGKSLIFNQLTGLGVEVSNYPGTTVVLHRGSTCVDREKVEILDLPGVYSIDGDQEEEALARTILTAGDLDGAIMVLNAMNLERNLYLLLQVAETGIPLVVVVNMMDEAEAAGLEMDLRKLSGILGTEVLGTAAASGRNLGGIMPLALDRARTAGVAVPYDADVEAAIRTLGKNLGATRVSAIWSLDGIGTDPRITEAAGDLAGEIEQSHRMSVHQIMALNRFTLSREIAGKIVKSGRSRAGIDLDQLLSREIPGIPILASVLVGMLLVVFVFGSFLEGVIVRLFQDFAIAPLLSLGLPPLAEKVAVAAVVGLQAGFGIAFPYILLFFLLLSVLEDSGYMTRAAFLADKAMHRVGMHGGAIIPMVVAFGCNVPAIMAARNLGTKRERLIAAFLITMVPCSARTVIIAGVVAAFVGIPAALSIYGMVFLVIFLTGMLLTRVTPGSRDRHDPRDLPPPLAAARPRPREVPPPAQGFPGGGHPPPRCRQLYPRDPRVLRDPRGLPGPRGPALPGDPRPPPLCGHRPPLRDPQEGDGRRDPRGPRRVREPPPRHEHPPDLHLRGHLHPLRALHLDDGGPLPGERLEGRGPRYPLHRAPRDRDRGND